MLVKQTEQNAVQQLVCVAEAIVTCYVLNQPLGFLIMLTTNIGEPKILQYRVFSVRWVYLLDVLSEVNFVPLRHHMQKYV